MFIRPEAMRPPAPVKVAIEEAGAQAVAAQVPEVPEVPEAAVADVLRLVQPAVWVAAWAAVVARAAVAAEEVFRDWARAASAEAEAQRRSVTA